MNLKRFAIVAAVATFFATAEIGRAQAPNGRATAPVSPQQSPTAMPMPSTLPAGIDHVYALQGENSLLIVADRSGFEHVRELVRNLTGVVDVVHTRIDAVDLTPNEQKSFGVSIDTSTPILSTADEAKLVDLWKHDKLQTSSYPLRVATRENTMVDVVMESRQGRVKSPISYVPRIAVDGRTIIEMISPASVMAAAPAGDTVVVVTPYGGKGGSTRLLFISQTISP